MTTIVDTQRAVSNELTAFEKSLKTDDLKEVDGRCGYYGPAPGLDDCCITEDSTRVHEALYRVAELHLRFGTLLTSIVF
jgi:hypothetical protein